MHYSILSAQNKMICPDKKVIYPDLLFHAMDAWLGVSAYVAIGLPTMVRLFSILPLPGS